MKGRVLLAGGFALAAAAATWLLASRARGGQFPLDSIRRGELVLAVPVTGSLESTAETPIGPPIVSQVWDFKISFLAPEGKRVRRGEVVLRFDDSDLRRQLATQQSEADAKRRRAMLKVEVPADLVAARELAKARSEADLADREVDFRRTALTALERRRQAEIAALRHHREGAESQVRELETAVRAMSVEAPVDGTVVYQANWRGDKKKVGDPSWRGEKILTIPDLSELRAIAEVDEADSGRVAVGQRVTLRLDAHPDVRFAGEVHAVGRTVARLSPNSPLKVALAEVALARVDAERMRPGMRFRGEIEVERIAGALLLPSAALVESPHGPQVFRRSLFGFDAVQPRLGRRGSSYLELLGGLDEGDRVALGDPRKELSR